MEIYFIKINDIFLKMIAISFKYRDLGCLRKVNMVKQTLKSKFQSLNPYFVKISWTLC